MRTDTLRILPLITLTLALAACNKPAEQPAAAPEQAAATTAPSAAPSAPAPGAAAPAAAAHGAKGLLTATPGAGTCDTGTDVKVAWDAAAAQGVANVEVWVGEGPEAKLFAAGGLTGEQQSGPWVKPGTVFVLRNQADKAELDRMTFGGTPCPVETPTAPAQ